MGRIEEYLCFSISNICNESDQIKLVLARSHAYTALYVSLILKLKMCTGSYQKITTLGYLEGSGTVQTTKNTFHVTFKVVSDGTYFITVLNAREFYSSTVEYQHAAHLDW